jgi:hypothetical protein
MNSTSTLKIHRPDARSLVEKIKGEMKKREDAKATVPVNSMQYGRTLM